ncbi:sensory box/GGDEF family protein [Gracilibacillus boraciitolerans JCM 21714]|uniref:Sensory box/GGDEF family protein n=1 Tax=Gracilibacillus boraciitolerans JCM 21714 TaxID=1298598 RepID=W4VQ90_9BACI|nr:diguanylate cyclase [Gracilibacillus boraciitolerans]GAE95387.1 sensory box/GGDEF family protein [Gracilibacillus boraciitolerans JCM 21714]
MNEYQNAFKEKIKLENFEISFVNKAGEGITLLVDSDFILVEGKTLQFLMVKDITEAKDKEEKVKFLAYHDFLTGLANRAAFEKRIADLLNRKKMFNLLLLDLNKLKQINDTFGHQAGDHAIQHITKILQEVAANTHYAARLGGDEFVMLLHADETETITIIKEMKQRLLTPLTLPEHDQICLSASIGVSYYPEDGETINELYRIADKRMYEEKQKLKSDN